MTKENMKVQYTEIENELAHLSEVSLKLRALINSPEFKDLSDLEATMVVMEHHQLEAFARVLTVRAALLGGRLEDPNGEQPSKHINDETPNPIIEPPKPEIQTGHSIRVGGTIITEG